MFIRINRVPRYLQTLNTFKLNKANLDLTFSYKCKFRSFDKKFSHNVFHILEEFRSHFLTVLVINSSKCSKKLIFEKAFLE